MAQSKHNSQSKKHKGSRKHAAGRVRKPIDPRAPWKPSWWVIWGFVTVICELILIFVQRAKPAPLSTLQVVVISVCIPFVTHLLVSGARTLLILSSSR